MITGGMMKFSVITTLLVFVTCAAMAQEGGFESGEQAPPVQDHDSGYKGTEDTKENQVINLEALRQDHWVTLEGYLLEQKGNDDYIFRDKTGKLLVTIPHAAWRERTFDSSDLIRISGRVDKKGKQTRLKVERVDEP